MWRIMSLHNIKTSPALINQNWICTTIPTMLGAIAGMMETFKAVLPRRAIPSGKATDCFPRSAGAARAHQLDFANAFGKAKASLLSYVSYEVKTSFS